MKVLQCYNNQSLTDIFGKGSNQLVEIVVRTETVFTIRYRNCLFHTVASEWNRQYFMGEKVILYKVVADCLKAKSSLCVIWEDKLFSEQKEIELSQLIDHPSIHVYDFGISLPKGFSIKKFKPKECVEEYGYCITCLYKLKYTVEHVKPNQLEVLTRDVEVKPFSDDIDDSEYDVHVKADTTPILYLPSPLFEQYQKSKEISSSSSSSSSTRSVQKMISKRQIQPPVNASRPIIISKEKIENSAQRRQGGRGGQVGQGQRGGRGGQSGGQRGGRGGHNGQNGRGGRGGRGG